MNEKVDTAQKPDRLLGDEWENWSGDLDESRIYNENAGLFTLFSGCAVLILLVALVFILYMIEPRLNSLHPLLVSVARVITMLVMVTMLVTTALIAISVFTRRNVVLNTRMGQLAAARIYPLASAIARKMGISRDRIGNSFVRFSNSIVQATYHQNGGKTIILMPRCLKPEIKNMIKELGEQVGIGVFSATGGGQARKIILRERPSSVIGIACERDLVSGISDVSPKMPTIGIVNKRPEGPCKNTLINIDELKDAISTFTGKQMC